jgi:hypothetical protein
VDNRPGEGGSFETMTVMSFTDLPQNARHLPLTDRRLAGDVIDLILGLDDRARGAVGMMVCDEHHRGLQPIVLKDIPDADEIVDGLTKLLEIVLPLVVETHGSVLIGRGRPHGSRPDDLDRACHERAIELCAVHRVRLLGFHVATREGVFAMPEPLASVS